MARRIEPIDYHPPALEFDYSAFDKLALDRVISETRLEAMLDELREKVLAYDDDNIRLPMSRFPEFCSRIGIEPKDVTEETIPSFRRALELSEIRKDPAKVAWHGAHAWNRAVERIPGWQYVFQDRSAAKSQQTFRGHFHHPMLNT